MEEQEDYYLILGLGSGLQGGNATSAAAIRKAYHTRALLCHPDKRPDDPLAAIEFQKLQKAYEVLGDELARKAYDDLLNVRKAKLERENQQSSKRRKMMEDLKERERASELQQKDKAEEERAAKRLQEEIARIRAMRAQKGFSGMFSEPAKQPKDDVKKPSGGVGTSDSEKMLKVSWLSADSGGSNYSAVRLKEVFQQFGTVEDIVIRPKCASKKSSALVVMSSRAEAVAATRSHCGDISNPLLVVPLVAHAGTSENNFVRPAAAVASESTMHAEENLSKIIGSGYHDYEDAILKKMQKKAEQTRSGR